MKVEPDGLEAAMERQCGTCTVRKGCPIEGAARVFWPEHGQFPTEWAHQDEVWRCSAYQPPRQIGTGRINDPSQAEMFA